MRWPWLLAGTALLGACSSCPPTRANWYLDDEPTPLLLLALVHEGPRQAHIDTVIVNPGTDLGAGGWRVHPSRPMQPGEVRVLRLDSFADAGGRPFPGCTFPVRVALQCDGHARSEAATLVGTLPNYLPAEWVKACGGGDPR